MLPVDPPAGPFRDGLGERAIILESATGEVMEALHLDEGLASQPEFEQAVRERMARLAEFDDHRFSTPVSLGRNGETAGALALVSRHPAALRLSHVLASAAGRRERFTEAVITDLAVTLAGALVAIQRLSKEMSVGTLAAERVLVTADSRILVTEHVFATAIEGLNLTREPLWRTFRVAAPQIAGRPRLDRRADLVQLGMIVLATIAGRPIGDHEFPGPLPGLVSEIFSAPPPPGFEPERFSALRSWLTRALQLDARRSFQMATDLQAALGEWVPAGRLPPDLVEGATAKSAAGSAWTGTASSPLRPSPVPPAGHGAVSPVAPAIGTLQSSLSSFQEAQALATPGVTPLAGAVLPLDLPLSDAGSSPVIESGHMARRVRRRRMTTSMVRRIWPWAAGAALVAALAVVGWTGWRRAVRPLGEGALVIDTRPQGAEVRIDEATKGWTPLRVSALEGDHSVELQLGERRRIIPVTVKPNESLTLSFEMRDVREMGQLEVRSEPTGAQVSIDGRPQGVAPLMVDIKAGTHVVRVRRGAAIVQHPVTVEPGRTASLLVSLIAASARPPSRPDSPSRSKPAAR